MATSNIGYLLKTISDRLTLRADADLKKQGLTFTQGRVLRFLHQNGGEATQKEIRYALDVSHPTVVGLVYRMEQSGYVTSRPDDSDKRNTIISLTPKAHAGKKEMKKHIEVAEKQLTRGLTDKQVSDLKKLLMILYDNLD